MSVPSGATSTVNWQFVELFAASVAVHVTVVVPIANVDPDAGRHETVAPQLSVAVGTVKFTTRPAEVSAVVWMFAGQESAGACVSLTVTLKLHTPVFDAASVAVQVTVVIPTAKVDPDAGTHASVYPGQLSEAEAE